MARTSPSLLLLICACADPPPPASITFHIDLRAVTADNRHDPPEMETFFYQDGEGPWQELVSDGGSANYSFVVKTGRYCAAWSCIERCYSGCTQYRARYFHCATPDDGREISRTVECLTSPSADGIPVPVLTRSCSICATSEFGTTGIGEFSWLAVEGVAGYEWTSPAFDIDYCGQMLCVGRRTEQARLTAAWLQAGSTSSTSAITFRQPDVHGDCDPFVTCGMDQHGSNHGYDLDRVVVTALKVLD